MKFAVTVVTPPGYLHSAAFKEVADTIHYGLRSLGHDSVLTSEGALAGRQHIVLGSNLLPHYRLPLAHDAILYNLEQVDAGSSWFRPELIDIFRRYVLWDYSRQNVAALDALGVQVAHVVPIGYVKELTRIQHVPEPDIDVLFFGSMSPRRKEIIDRMQADGLRVETLFGIYGKERDAFIARAKLLLNVHFYDAKVLEMVRISYLLANRCAVLSEYSSDPDEVDALAEGVAFAEYQHLAQRARELIDAPEERERLARRGFEIMRARPAVEYLRAALARPRGPRTQNILKKMPSSKAATKATSRLDQSKLHQALALHQKGYLDQAQALYEEVLKAQPKNFDALHLLGVVYSQQKRYSKAVELIRKAIKICPDNPLFHSNCGVALSELRQLDAAVASYDRAIAIQPDYAEAHYNRGNALQELQHRAAAVTSYDRAIAIKPDYAEAHYNRGNVLKELRELDAAVASYDRAIAIQPNLAQAHCNRGNALAELKQDAAAVASYDRAIAINPDYAQAHSNRGNALKELGQFAAAVASYDRAIAIQPDYAQAHSNRGNALVELKQIAAAVASYDRAIAIEPDYAQAHYNRGNALTELQQFAAAVASYDRAIAIDPRDARTHYNRGNALTGLKLLEAALASYDRAIALEPGYAEAYGNRGNALQDLQQLDAALASYEQAIAIKPDIDYLLGTLLHTKMKLCDWRGFEASTSELFRKIENKERATTSSAALALTTSPALQQEAARIYGDHKYPADFSLGIIPKRPKSARLRIGYFSADFHHHATSYLMAELLEQHDKERFELIAFSFGPAQEDAMRQRIAAAFSQFIDVRSRSDREIAMLARQLEIDMAVDLKGYTQDHRAGIFSFRAAPVQVGYLGYPGTMASAYMDYLIADRTLIPSGSQRYYSEKIVYLPNSYQVSDTKREIADRVFTRHELGLPEDGFVFCCFNNHYKITPGIFDGWMRILHRVAGSVLWLLGGTPTVLVNLRKEARARGVSDDRLIFAERLPLPEHLARQRAADLFLDTLPCNAHTTANDALWAGLPVLTCMGDSFASRVAGSLLNAIHLPELITHNQADYEALAIELATDPKALSGIKATLTANRLTAPLFDTARFTRHLEAAFRQMYERYRADLPPDHIYIEP